MGGCYHFFNASHAM